MLGPLRWLRRRKLGRLPFPDSWNTILEKRVPFYARLNDPEKARFKDLLKVFAREKHFFGAQGLEITDEIRVVVSACAIRLVFNLGLSYYDRLSEIVVYPYIYQHENHEGAILGEARDWGTVVLAWPAVLRGLADPRDGHETALHEFAHVLDRADGAFDGTPRLESLADYGPWARVMSHHYLRLQKRKPKERKVLDRYGATNEAEFFSVATEAFFEKPVQMKKWTPELYQALREFYRTDPGARLDGK